jgi:hypothetical protein
MSSLKYLKPDFGHLRALVSSAISKLLAADDSAVKAEIARLTRFNVLSDLGEKYLGSDEWLLDHTKDGRKNKLIKLSVR